MEFFGVLLALIGGMTNGSYPAPKNYCKEWKDSHIWSAFALCAFLLIPLVILLSHAQTLSFLSYKAFVILIVSGLLFSLGMAAFTFSLKKIGLGPAFSLNIIIGTSLGTLVPLFLFHSNEIFSKYSLLIYIGIALFILSIIFLYASLSSKAYSNQKQDNIYGVVFGILSGALTSLQSSAYNYAINELSTDELSQILNKLVIWSIFFISSFPIFFLIHFMKAKKLAHTFKQFKKHNFKLIFIMAMLYYLSILLFSWSTNYISIPVAWPIFMTSIVLTTNFWSTKFNELQEVKKRCYIGYIMTTLSAFLFFAFSMHLGN